MNTNLLCKYWNRTKQTCLGNWECSSATEGCWMTEKIFWSRVEVQTNAKHADPSLLNCISDSWKRQVNPNDILYCPGSQLGKHLQKLRERNILLWPWMVTATLLSLLWPQISSWHVMLPRSSGSLSAQQCLPTPPGLPVLWWQGCPGGGPHYLP